MVPVSETSETKQHENPFFTDIAFLKKGMASNKECNAWKYLYAAEYKERQGKSLSGQVIFNRYADVALFIGTALFPKQDAGVLLSRWVTSKIDAALLSKYSNSLGLPGANLVMKNYCTKPAKRAPRKRLTPENPAQCSPFLLKERCSPYWS